MNVLHVISSKRSVPSVEEICARGDLEADVSVVVPAHLERARVSECKYA